MLDISIAPHNKSSVGTDAAYRATRRPQRWIGFTHSEWRAGGLLSPQASRRMGKKAPDMTCMKAVRNSRIVVRLRLKMFNPSISLGKP
ncbi:unnamed protein product [Aspergillus oryzae var. brunneus]|uniref:Unnamed protein product n=1 Tax=Aspergillus oryzae var. brunneus TaxID=332754 RepID=A0ABQ6LC65_ASPOZ|nr:unnamed protein product [Aspergillus oryzae]GMG53259.1 unnamed protein product [Aspergillus oryzae var. brunneus]